jgi:hypothetical protein
VKDTIIAPWTWAQAILITPDVRKDTEPGCESGCFDKRLSVRPCAWFRVDISGNPANIYHGCFIFNCPNEVRANTVVLLKSIPPAPYVVRLQLRKEVRVWWSKGNAKGLNCRIVTAQAPTTKFSFR